MYGVRCMKCMSHDMAAEHIGHADMHACTCTHEYVNVYSTLYDRCSRCSCYPFVVATRLYDGLSSTVDAADDDAWTQMWFPKRPNMAPKSTLANKTNPAQARRNGAYYIYIYIYILLPFDFVPRKLSISEWHIFCVLNNNASGHSCFLRCWSTVQRPDEIEWFTSLHVEGGAWM